MKLKLTRCSVIYPLSEIKLTAEIIAEGEKGCCIRITSKDKAIDIPKDSCIVLNCLYLREVKK